MSDKYLFLVSMPGLRARDLAHMPRLAAVAEGGSRCELAASFPCVTSSVQVNMLTGRLPSEHGIIGNGFYHRDRSAVELWVGRNGLVQGDQVFEALGRRGIKQAVWMAQNIRDAAADFIVTPEPIHHPDGRTEPWCYSKPEGLYRRLVDDIGHFPLMNYWGPMVGIGSTEWIINGSMWLLQRERPQFHYIYVPHLDYAAQKFGPDSAQQAAACREADIQIGRLVDGVRAIGIRDAEFLVVSEYAMTAVSRVVYPNRVLREAGLAVVKEIDGREHLDPRASAAFAVVDHQFAHVYVRDRADIDAASGIFEGMKGIAQVLTGDERSRLGVNHPRSGEVVLVCEADAWLAYYWWHDDSKAPAFARTVDIHNKPGYDPVEMFFDPAMRSIPLNATLVRGSHGAPATMPDQIGVAVSSDPGRLAGREKARDVDVRSLIDAAFHAN